MPAAVRVGAVFTAVPLRVSVNVAPSSGAFVASSYLCTSIVESFCVSPNARLTVLPASPPSRSTVWLALAGSVYPGGGAVSVTV